jgi:hypothetical protein
MSGGHRSLDQRAMIGHGDTSSESSLDHRNFSSLHEQMAVSNIELNLKIG